MPHPDLSPVRTWTLVRAHRSRPVFVCFLPPASVHALDDPFLFVHHCSPNRAAPGRSCPGGRVRFLPPAIPATRQTRSIRGIATPQGRLKSCLWHSAIVPMRITSHSTSPPLNRAASAGHSSPMQDANSAPVGPEDAVGAAPAWSDPQGRLPTRFLPPLNVRLIRPNELVE
jgi:hypothetical protein